MPTPLILAGMPGRMCREIAALLAESPWAETFSLPDFALSGSKHAGTHHSDPDLELVAVESLSGMDTRGAIVIDYSTPSAALGNIAAYTKLGLPFVMGTTGFDSDAAEKLVRASKSVAVIAPNMAIPIVLIQTALVRLAADYPEALRGYDLSIMESHQSTKKDTSGTAKALLPSLTALGALPEDPPIDSVRDRDLQVEMGIPTEHLEGHGHHWYALRSPREDVTLELSHRVNGRRVYAEGTLRAAEWLAKKIATSNQGTVYTMQDVLTG